MTLKVMSSENKVSSQEIRFTMVGGTYSEPTYPQPSNFAWLSNKLWCGICEASDTVPAFKGLKETF